MVSGEAKILRWPHLQDQSCRSMIPTCPFAATAAASSTLAMASGGLTVSPPRSSTPSAGGYRRSHPAACPAGAGKTMRRTMNAP